MLLFLSNWPGKTQVFREQPSMSVPPPMYLNMAVENHIHAHFGVAINS